MFYASRNVQAAALPLPQGMKEGCVMTSQIRGLIRFSMGLLVGLAILLSAGCRSDAASEAPVGELAMALATTSPLGVEYRLRDALFRISGPDSMDVSSEDYPPEQTQIAVSLASGDYLVWLLDGWFIEHRAFGDEFTPIPADLVSPNPLAPTVNAGEVTQLTFQFQVDEGLINFGPGTLSIDFDVEEATALTVFVSDAQVSSNIGGIAVADSICRSEAEAAGLKGTFSAWLSDSGYSPASDWGLAGGSYRFVRPDGVLVASSWENLVDDTVTYPLLNSINVKADGTLIPDSDPPAEYTVWTGTRADGSAFPGTNCDGWTSTDNSLDTLIGGAVGTAGDWTEWATYDCGDNAHRFYCFEQVECNTNEECDVSADQCIASVCLDHQCALEPVPDGTPCSPGPQCDPADGMCSAGVCESTSGCGL